MEWSEKRGVWDIDLERIHDIEACQHIEECKFVGLQELKQYHHEAGTEKETKKNFLEFDSTPTISGSNNTMIINKVIGDDNSLSGGNVGRNVIQWESMWKLLEPLFAMAFFVLLLAVIIVCFK